jgi:sugar/nucleoside kinase (ribokinase family)
MLICTLGDQTLDVVVRLSGALAAGGDTDAEIEVGPGGQAANVAAWAVALGARARSIGKRGSDDPGRLVRTGLEQRGVEVIGPEKGRTGVVCSLVSPDGARSMAADRAAAADLRPQEIEAAWLDGCDHLFVSGYSVLREPARGAAVRAVELARERGAGVSIDLSTWSAIRDAGADEVRVTLERLAPDVVFANEDEERIVGGRFRGPAWIIKRGPNGATFDGVEREALPVERVVDSTGAGDALAAGFLVGGPDLALEAAGRCVARLGSLP